MEPRMRKCLVYKKNTSRLGQETKYRGAEVAAISTVQASLALLMSDKNDGPQTAGSCDHRK
eukprot:scaffold408_cov71-Cylindrotheca_fusiformis.AAC.30